MKKALLSLAGLVFVLGTVGCSDPCGELKDKCADCSDQSNCEAGVELVETLLGDDGCEAALDEDDVCGEEAME